MKLHRARHLVSELAHLEDEYLGSAVRLERTPADPDATERWQLRIDRELPAEFATLVATTIQTTRGALDDLAVSLVIACGRTPRNTTFPIAISAHHYVEEQSHCLRRATPAAREAVRSVAPWRGADDRLWELHQLDTAGRRLPVLHLAQSVPREPVRVPSALRVLQKADRGPGARYPLKDSHVLTLPATLDGDTDVGTLLRASIHVVLGEGELVRGRPVVGSLDMLITHTAGVIDRVVAAADHR